MASSVDFEAGDVGAGVVAGGVEVLALFADVVVAYDGDEELFGGTGGRDDPYAVRTGEAGSAVGEDVGAFRGEVLAPGG